MIYILVEKTPFAPHPQGGSSHYSFLNRFIQLRYTAISVVKSTDSIGVSDQPDYNRQDRWTPLPAIRETLPNALTHRDYDQSGSRTPTTIFTSMASIASPRGRTVSKLRDGGDESLSSSLLQKISIAYFRDIFILHFNRPSYSIRTNSGFSGRPLPIHSQRLMGEKCNGWKRRELEKLRGVRGTKRCAPAHSHTQPSLREEAIPEHRPDQGPVAVHDRKVVLEHPVDLIQVQPAVEVNQNIPKTREI